MLVLQQISIPYRHFSTCRPCLALVEREYRGDPGPSTRRHELLRVGTMIRRGGSQGHGVLEKTRMINGDLREARRSRQISRGRPESQPGRGSRSGERSRFGSTSQGRSLDATLRSRPRARFDSISKGFYTPQPRTVSDAALLQSDPYDTSRQLRDWIKAHPSPINHNALKQAIEMVAGAEKGAVNSVVWNTLLALVGREGSLETMWKLYNVVGRWLISQSRQIANLPR